MLSHRSSGKIGSAGVKPTPKDQKPAPMPQMEESDVRGRNPLEETVFRPPKEKRKKLKFQRE
jgi:hypothetical protein